MTPEQKQRIERIRRAVLLLNSPLTQAVREDIDFLLSLVKSQEARAFPDPRHWEPVGPPVVLPAPLLPHSYEEYVLGFCPEKGRGNAILSVEGELTLLGKNVVRELSNRVATSMRSACVEKLRERANRYQALANNSLPNDQTAARTAAAAAALNSAASELESLSIEQPKEK